MNSKKFNENTKALKIRKILLTFVDIEIKKKKKNSNFIIINSMNPNELEIKNIVQINQGPINILSLHFTNITEKYLIKRVVDKKNNINYFYSDHLGRKNGMLILTERQKNFVVKFSPKILKMDIGMTLHNNDEYKNKKESPKNPKDYFQLYTFNLIKKEIGDNKIKNKLQSKENNKEEEENNPNKQERHFKEKMNIKIRSIKYLINYCYSHINKKKQLANKSVEKYNNIHLIEKYEAKNIINSMTKRNKYGKSKDKIYKTKNGIISVGNKEQKKINTHISSKNNCFVNKFKKYLENNKMKLPLKGESVKKIKRNIPNSNQNNNFYEIITEDMKDSKVKKREKSKIKSLFKKKAHRYSISTFDYSSPEYTNKLEHKHLKKRDFLFRYNISNYITSK